MKFGFTSLLTHAASLFLLACSSIASANIATFDDVPEFTSTPITSGGLDFNGSTSYVWSTYGQTADNGTSSLLTGFGDSVTITKHDGGAFTLDQFDAGLSWYSSEDWLTLSVGTEAITINQFYQTFSFSDLTNITAITIGFAPVDGFFTLDNVVWHDVTNVSQVPEPSPWIMFGLGIVGLLLGRRSIKPH